MQPQEPAPVPPPPPFALSTEIDPSCETDVDLEADDDDLGVEQQLLAQDTVREELVYLGTYDSLESYFRSQLEDLIDPCLHSWIFDALDMDTVQRAFEGSNYRYIKEGQAVWRAGMPPKKPSKDKDPSPGPWMPTRGG